MLVVSLGPSNINGLTYTWPDLDLDLTLTCGNTGAQKPEHTHTKDGELMTKRTLILMKT